MTRSYYRGAEGCLLVYDVTSRRSFNSLVEWLDDLKQWAEDNIVVVLIGNKGSYRILITRILLIPLSTADAAESTREVTTTEGQEWALEHGMEYLETSAKTGHNIETAFESTARKVHERLLANKEELARKRKRQGSSFPSVNLGSAASASRIGGCC